MGKIMAGPRVCGHRGILAFDVFFSSGMSLVLQVGSFNHPPKTHKKISPCQDVQPAPEVDSGDSGCLNVRNSYTFLLDEFDDTILM